ncbi:hypothetical protein TWF281_007042 [Arthrobotrys megalospora]
MDPQLSLKTPNEITTEEERKKYRDKIREFADTLKGESVSVYLPGEEEYERSVATSNLLYRFARPDCVVQPLNANDVQTVVREAVQYGLPMTIKGGGHSYAGFSTAHSGISLDLGKMNRARLDMKRNPPVMTMQGGAKWGHAYKHLINGKYDGYIVNGGRCPTVGVGGFLLGGGLAPFGRSFGLGCDTLIEATIVDAKGDIITVSREDLKWPDDETDKDKIKRKKLFWALCGAGGGNFGVVVEFKLAVQKLKQPHGLVVAGKYEWKPPYKKDELSPAQQEDGVETQVPTVVTPETIATMNTFYSYEWPDECTIDTSWVFTVGQPIFIRFLVYYDGTKEQFKKLIDPTGENGEDLPDDEKPIKDKALRGILKRRMIEEPSTRFLHETLVDQWSDEIVKAFPTNKSYDLHVSFVFPNDKETIETITKYINEAMGSFQEKFSGETATIQITWIHSGGKVSKYGASDTAYPWRDGVYNVYVKLEWDGKWLEEDLRDYLQTFRNDLRQYSLEKRAAYVNFPFPDEIPMTSDEYEAAYYGQNAERLREVKLDWDPDEYFKWHQGVQLPKATYTMQSSFLAAEVDGLSIPTFSVAARTMNTIKVESDGQTYADSLARKQWEHFKPALHSWSSGGIHALTDLGF